MDNWGLLFFSRIFRGRAFGQRAGPDRLGASIVMRDAAVGWAAVVAVKDFSPTTAYIPASDGPEV
jgi:hypothetical protein